VFLNKGVDSIISFTKWVKNFLNFKPQGVASFTASGAPSIYGKMATAVFRLNCWGSCGRT